MAEDSRRQHTPSYTPKAEPQLFVLPSHRDWCRSSVFSVPSKTQQASGPKPHLRQRNQRNWWEAFNSGILWRSSGLVLGDKMWDLGSLPRQVHVGCLKTHNLWLDGYIMGWAQWCLGVLPSPSVLLTIRVLVSAPGKLCSLRSPLLPSVKCYLF